VRVEYGLQSLLFAGSCWECASDLTECANVVDFAGVIDDILAALGVLQQERADIALALLKQFLYRGDYDRVSDRDGLVEAREEWALGDGNSHDLRVDIRDRRLDQFTPLRLALLVATIAAA